MYPPIARKGGGQEGAQKPAGLKQENHKQTVGDEQNKNNNKKRNEKGEIGRPAEKGQIGPVFLSSRIRSNRPGVWGLAKIKISGDDTHHHRTAGFGVLFNFGSVMRDGQILERVANRACGQKEPPGGGIGQRILQN